MLEKVNQRKPMVRQTDRQKEGAQESLIGKAVKRRVMDVLTQLSAKHPTKSDLYHQVRKEMEAVLFDFLLVQTQGHHGQACRLLGLNRGTFRKRRCLNNDVFSKAKTNHFSSR